LTMNIKTNVKAGTGSNECHDPCNGGTDNENKQEGLVNVNVQTGNIDIL
jgi:hypothetical protein